MGRCQSPALAPLHTCHGPPGLWGGERKTARTRGAAVLSETGDMWEQAAGRVGCRPAWMGGTGAPRPAYTRHPKWTWVKLDPEERIW